LFRLSLLKAIAGVRQWFEGELSYKDSRHFGGLRPEVDTLALSPRLFNEGNESAPRSPTRSPSRTEIAAGCARRAHSTSGWLSAYTPFYYREAIADLIHGYVNPGGAMG
jgi:hypothetical protein